MLLQLYLIKDSHKYKILNQIIGKISRSCVTDQEKINTNDLYYQCSKHGPDCLFGKFRIKDLMMNHILPNKQSGPCLEH